MKAKLQIFQIHRRIVLVIIGILIALQINNWNVENADHKRSQLFEISKNEMEKQSSIS
jgi:hypothetical protein